jgi:c-di-GMP-binding flagellar brake protein YcgR
MSQNEIASTEFIKMPLKAMGLRPGMALQTKRLVEGAPKNEAQYFSAIEGKGVMLGPLGADTKDTGLLAGEVCIVRGFTGQHEFSFLTKVLQTFDQPFIYALLAYPEYVEARLVRQSLRIKTSWPTTVKIPKDGNIAGAPELDVTMIDLSTAGTMIKSDSILGAVGDSILLYISATMDNAPISIALEARICHSNKAPDNDGYFVGVSFKNLSQQDKLVLNYLTQTPVAA